MPNQAIEPLRDSARLIAMTLDNYRGCATGAGRRKNGAQPGEETMTFLVELEQEENGRWIAEVVDLPGVLAYGQTPEEATAKGQALALRVVADRLEHGKADPDFLSISFAAA